MSAESDSTKVVQMHIWIEEQDNKPGFYSVRYKSDAGAQPPTILYRVEGPSENFRNAVKSLNEKRTLHTWQQIEEFMAALPDYTFTRRELTNNKTRHK